MSKSFKKRTKLSVLATLGVSIFLSSSILFFEDDLKKIGDRIKRKNHCISYLKGEGCETFICDYDGNGYAEITQLVCQNGVFLERKAYDEEKAYFIENKD